MVDVLPTPPLFSMHSHSFNVLISPHLAYPQWHLKEFKHSRKQEPVGKAIATIFEGGDLLHVFNHNSRKAHKSEAIQLLH